MKEPDYDDYDIVPQGGHWPRRMHTENEWEYLGSVSSTKNKYDVYRHKIKEAYSGISMQYGDEEHQYWSSSILAAQPLPGSFPESIAIAFALEYDRVLEK